MANKLSFSFINPLQLVDINPVNIPQYISRFMDDYLLTVRLNQWQAKSFLQVWQNNDVVTLQAQNNMGALQVDIIDCKQSVFLSFLMDQKQQNLYEPTTFIYESNSSLGPLPESVYFLRVTAGGGLKTMISEPICVKELHENSLLIEYVNRSFYQGIIFETGITPSIRVQGLLTLKDTQAKDTIYEDQVLDMVMVQSKPFEVYELLLFQIPDWMRKKINRIIGCSDLRIDGKFFTKNEGAKWEKENITDNGLLADYKIELRELINRDSKLILTDENENQELNIILNVDSKGFADTSLDASSTILTVIDVE